MGHVALRMSAEDEDDAGGLGICTTSSIEHNSGQTRLGEKVAGRVEICAWNSAGKATEGLERMARCPYGGANA